MPYSLRGPFSNGVGPALDETTMNWLDQGIANATATAESALSADDIEGIVGDLVDVATINYSFGARNGVPIKPWEAPAPSHFGELWRLNNFRNAGASYQTTSLTPSLTPNGTGQTTITQARYADTVGGNDAFRIEFDYTLPTDGWGGVSLRIVGAGGTQWANEQWLITNSSPANRTGHVLFDFAPGKLTSDLYIDVKLRLENNSTTGLPLAISNVSLRQITSDSIRPMLLTKQYTTGAYPLTYFQHRDNKTGAWKMCESSFGPDGTAGPYALTAMTAFADDMPFANPLPDPMLKRSFANSTSVGAAQVASPPGAVNIRSGNNDQIILAWDGTAYEYRGNIHGGEVPRPGTDASTSLKIDRGAGLVPWTLEHMLTAVRRFQFAMPTEMRLTVDGTDPFCSVDHLVTVFADGMVRCDRTTTFLKSTQMEQIFEWMSTHNNETAFLGRLGRGLTVIGETDSHPKVAAPATPGSSTSTSGGTLAAGTYSYRVTALSPYGESTGSTAKTQVTTGSTSTVTVTWSAVTNATGYRVYGRTGGVEKLIGSTTALTFTDTGATPPLGDLPVVNTANLYNNTSVDTMAQSDVNTWGVYREPRTGWCTGSIYDRDAVLNRPGITAIHTRLLRGNGVQKNYANLAWGTSPSLTVAPGTTWSATHWYFTYLPADPEQFHQEIAVRAASLGALKSIYPNT